jgi:hypothetical protein
MAHRVIEQYEHRWPIGTKQRLAFDACSTSAFVVVMPRGWASSTSEPASFT